MQATNVETGHERQHRTVLVDAVIIIAFGFTALRSTDNQIVVVSLVAACLLFLYRCWISEARPLFRVAMAALAVFLFGFVLWRFLYYPAPLTLNQNTSTRLAEASNEQDVRDIITENARAFRSLLSVLVPAQTATRAMSSEPPAVESIEAEKKVLESKITLFEFYPKYEWPLSGATSLAPMPLEGATLKAVFVDGRDDYRLTPLIRNSNSDWGIALLEPRITVAFPLPIEVRPTRFWAPNISETFRSFFTAVRFGPVLSGPTGVNESLFLKFPSPGSYQVRYRIEGIARDIAVQVTGGFTLELVTP